MHEKMMALEAAVLAMADNLARQGLIDTEIIAKDTLKAVSSCTWMSDEGRTSAREFARKLASIKLELPQDPPETGTKPTHLRLVE